MRSQLLAPCVGALVLVGAATAETLPVPPDAPEAREIARRAEDTMRSGGTYLEAVMTVVSPRRAADHEVGFRSWDDRIGRRSFIRILSPSKDAGTRFLKLHPNLWKYVPRVARTLRIPQSMMMESWMGSDFTNDDMVKESSALDDYDHHLLGVDPDPPGGVGASAWVLEYLPHEDAPVVWEKIVAWIEREHAIPLRQDFYDAAGKRVRQMDFSEVRAVQGRHIPHRWTMTPLDKEGHQTRIEVREIRLDQTFDERIFTTRQLKKRD